MDVFSAAKITGAQDKRMQERYNYLIDLLSKHITANATTAHDETQTAYATLNAFIVSILNILDGGNDGQIMKKMSDTNYDIEWVDDTSLWGAM